MARSFSAAMAKLGLLGQNSRTLVDCTEIIVRGLRGSSPALCSSPIIQPRAPPTTRTAAVIPAGKTRQDIQSAVSTVRVLTRAGLTIPAVRADGVPEPRDRPRPRHDRRACVRSRSLSRSQC